MSLSTWSRPAPIRSPAVQGTGSTAGVPCSRHLRRLGQTNPLAQAPESLESDHRRRKQQLQLDVDQPQVPGLTCPVVHERRNLVVDPRAVPLVGLPGCHGLLCPQRDVRGLIRRYVDHRPCLALVVNCARNGQVAHVWVRRRKPVHAPARFGTGRRCFPADQVQLRGFKSMGEASLANSPWLCGAGTGAMTPVPRSAMASRTAARPYAVSPVLRSIRTSTACCVSVMFRQGLNVGTAAPLRHPAHDQVRVSQMSQIMGSTCLLGPVFGAVLAS